MTGTVIRRDVVALENKSGSYLVRVEDDDDLLTAISCAWDVECNEKQCIQCIQAAAQVSLE